ncbi:histidine phosphotransferase family protein [uncultured Sulfitobacter sp.]|uniref:histidine phosphotransferase family protein n=1 Tax=uncultured Sulfitobacter sp. TaxID=191468 RepID=UPI00260F4DA1|nr:histidine phosphotransferase family protein [uncultured Sulfitobacter sp.]
MDRDTAFATLIGSRICHDLISPIGAINNGLELIEMSNPAGSPELALISESVSSASARIRFFRIAFGAAGEQMVSRAEVVSILEDVYASGRLKIVWQPSDGLQRTYVKLAFLALLCLETGMPYGGRVEITLQQETVILTGHADKLNIDEALWTRLSGGPEGAALVPAHVQFGLLPVIASDEGRKVRVSSEETRIVITI